MTVMIVLTKIRRFWIPIDAIRKHPAIPVGTKILHCGGAAGHGNYSGSHHFDNSKGTQHFNQAIDLVFCAGDFDDQRIVADIHDFERGRHPQAA